MSSRQTRSPSIPIPTNTAAVRSIENAFSLPFRASPSAIGNARPRLSAIPRSQIHNSPERGVLASSPRTISTAPFRTISGSYSSVASRPSVGSSTNQPQPVFEPRIIRAATSPARSVDPACFPASTSPTAPRTRRPSATRLPSAASALIASGVRPSALSAQLQSASMLPPPQIFARPAYLDQSALRDLLVTESSISTGAVRQGDQFHRTQTLVPPPQTTTSPATASLLTYHSYIRQSTPSVDDGSDQDSASSPPPPSSAATPAIGAIPIYMSNTIFRLPTRWNEMDRHTSLQVTPDGRELTFCGPACPGDKEASAARANYPVPPACGIYYYEVEIVQKGTKGHISIGFSASDVRLSRLPGWEKHSWGYHADDGWSFPGHKDGNPYGPTFETGDIIGCGIDFSQHRVFYTKNGAFLGMVFENVGKGYEIYPSVGLRHTGEAIRVNFGHAPFKFAIEDHVLSQRNAVWGKIQETKIDWDLLRGENKPVDNEVKPATVIDPSSGVAVVEGDEAVEDKSPMRNLVMSYLAHHGYVNTVKAFQAQCESRSAVGGTTSESSSGMKEDGMEMDETLSVPLSQSSSSLASASRLETAQDRELLTRVEIVNSVTKGDIDTAITRTQDHFPGVFKREEGLMLFKLRCRKFVELILEASEALKRVNPESSRERGRRDAGQEMYGGADGMDGVGAMDVDDPSPEARTPASEPTISSASISSTSTSPDAPDTLPSHIHASAHPMRISRSISSSSSTTTNSNNTSTTSPSAIAKNALTTALMYGQTLEADYKGDIRPEVRSHLKRTFGIVAYTDPLAAGGEVAEMAGEGARVRLATELNQAILESQGKPPHPALEMAYRQASACIVQLGLLNFGSAAFADMSKEFLEA